MEVQLAAAATEPVGRIDFEQLVQAHQDRVYDFCVRMLGDREEALEVVQEIFVSVHQALPTFRFDSKVSTWIYRISKNHCLNRLKYLERRGGGGGGGRGGGSGGAGGGAGG